MTLMQQRFCSQDRWNICKYFLLSRCGCCERQRSCEWLQRTPCPPGAAPPQPMDGLRHHPPPPPAQVWHIIFPSPPNCCLTYLKISTSGHFDTFAVTINSFSFVDQGSPQKIVNCSYSIFKFSQAISYLPSHLNPCGHRCWSIHLTLISNCNICFSDHLPVPVFNQG